MNESYIIKGFCIVRNNKVIINGREEIFPGSMPVGEFLASVYRHFSICYPKFYKMDNLSKLGFITAELLIKEINALQNYGDDETGLIISNASSSLDVDTMYQNSINNREDYFPSPAVFVYTLPNILIGEISIRHKMLGEGTFFVHEKFDPGFLYTYTKILLSGNIIKSCITGWVEVLGDSYESVLYFIEKGQTKNGIVIFEPSKMTELYNEKF